MGYLYYCFYCFVSSVFNNTQTYHARTRIVLWMTFFGILSVLLEHSGLDRTDIRQNPLPTVIQIFVTYYLNDYYFKHNNRGEKAVAFYFEKRIKWRSIDSLIGMSFLLFSFLLVIFAPIINK